MVELRNDLKTKEFRRAKTLHAILTLALGDFQKSRRSKTCRIEMTDWTSKWDAGAPCSVCLGGAVIRWRLIAPNRRSTFSIGPERFSSKTANKLYALNDLRTGGVSFAAQQFYGDKISKKKLRQAEYLDRYIEPYEHDERAWLKAMKVLLADLQAAGL